MKPYSYTFLNDEDKKYITNWVHFILFEYNLKTSEFRLTPFVTQEGVI